MPRLENRRPRAAGEYTTNQVAAPARGQNEATMYRAYLDLAAGDLADPTLTIDMYLEGSTDGGATWRSLAFVLGWTGGFVGKDGTIHPPHVSWISSDPAIVPLVHVRWLQSKSASVGASLDTETQTVIRATQTP